MGKKTTKVFGGIGFYIFIPKIRQKQLLMHDIDLSKTWLEYWPAVDVDAGVGVPVGPGEGPLAVHQVHQDLPPVPTHPPHASDSILGAINTLR